MGVFLGNSKEDHLPNSGKSLSDNTGRDNPEPSLLNFLRNEKMK